MKEIVAKRIKSARLLAGLSLRELSNKMEHSVSYNAIAKYEKAEMMPDSKVLIALSRALQVKTDYFSRPYSVNIPKIAFRKRKKLGIKIIRALEEEITETLSRYLEVEQFLNIETSFFNPLINITIREGEDVEQAVSQLIHRWNIGIDAIPNVIEMLEDKEIKVIETDAPPEFDGLSGWVGNNIPVLVINKNYENERKRFTALHELGHTILQFDQSLSEKEIEKLCHRFAGALLIPKETFLIELGQKRTSISLNELKNMKESYGISIQAIMARAKDLEVITPNTFVQFCIQISKNRTEKGLGQYIGKERSDRFKSLVFRAASEEIISMSKAANLCNQKLASFRDEFVIL
ncbi:MAG: XRE family transcriptional regulator [Bacteroidales bacterium]|nr:XRE family transcriptional regulator [Bacteroidales bacterium]